MYNAEMAFGVKEHAHKAASVCKMRTSLGVKAVGYSRQCGHPVYVLAAPQSALV